MHKTNNSTFLFSVVGNKLLMQHDVLIQLIVHFLQVSLQQQQKTKNKSAFCFSCQRLWGVFNSSFTTQMCALEQSLLAVLLLTNWVVLQWHPLRIFIDPLHNGSWFRKFNTALLLYRITLRAVLWLPFYETEARFSYHALQNMPFFSASVNGREHVLSPPPDVTHLRRASFDHSNARRGRVSKCTSPMFIFISSWLCLSRVWLLPDRALRLLVAEYIINNLHVISSVLIIFVWWNVFLHGECRGYLPHLEAQGTSDGGCYATLCD